MKLLEAYQMVEIAENVKEKHVLNILARNLKVIRLVFYSEYEKLNKRLDNPYSVKNIASLLEISPRHYQRLENPNYVSKNISIEKLIILSEIYNIPFEELFKNEE